MDPTILEQLFNQGKINQQTYDMAKQNIANKQKLDSTAMAKASTAPDMMASLPMVPAPAPAPTGEQMPASAPAQPAQTPPPAPTAASQPTTPMQPTVTPVTSTTINTELGSKESTTTSGKVKSAAEKQAEKDYAGAIEAQKNANAGTADTATKKAAEQFNIEQERTRMLQEQAEKRQAAAAEAQKEMDARLAKIDADVEALKNSKYEGFWAKRGTGERIMGAIAVGLGAYGAATGGSKQNYAMDIINKAMDDDFAQYKQGIDQQLAAISQSRLSLKSKEDLTKQKLDALDAYKLGQVEVLKSKVDELGSKFGGEDAKNKLAELNAALDAKSAEKRMEIEDKYAQQYSKTIEKEFAQTRVDANGNVISGPGSPTTTDAGKPMSDSQLKAQGSLDVMNEALKGMEEAYKQKDFNLNNFSEAAQSFYRAKSVSNVPVVGGLAGFITDPIANAAYERMSESEKTYFNKVNNFISEKLRKESGASISKEEFDNEYRRYFPMPGDTQKQIAEKRKELEAAMRSMRTQTGRTNQPTHTFGDDAESLRDSMTPEEKRRKLLEDAARMMK